MSDSWGNLYRSSGSDVNLSWRDAALPDEKPILVVGNRRSYGDVCVNDGATTIDVTGLNRFIAFDRQSGLLRCESGLTLWQIARFVLPHGWFLPVSPGTGFVTVGGAVSNDVHGKNHHVAGSFGCFVKRFELRRSNGEVLVCSASENAELFAATIGGLGLTGLITWVEFQLKPVSHSLMDVESIPYSSYEDFLSLSQQSEQSHEYCVSWINCLDASGGGVFFRGNHAQQGALDVSLDESIRQVPAIVGAGFPLVNRLSLKAFNFLYLRAHRNQREYKETIRKFFYPLDALGNWNRIYGRRGFYQFQCVVPFENSAVLKTVLMKLAKDKQGSFLSVLKTMGDVKSPGLLSFCRPGVTLALDFPNRGRRTSKLLKNLEQLVVEADGAIYPAKDATMDASTFVKSFPNLSLFNRHIDPAFSSSFWRRVNAS